MPKTGVCCGSGAASAPVRSVARRESAPETAPTAATVPPHAYGIPPVTRVALGDAAVAEHPVPDTGTPRVYADRSSPTRSEERRVGKECRSRWTPYQLKQNDNT